MYQYQFMSEKSSRSVKRMATDFIGGIAATQVNFNGLYLLELVLPYISSGMVFSDVELAQVTVCSPTFLTDGKRYSFALEKQKSLEHI